MESVVGIMVEWGVGIFLDVCAIYRRGPTIAIGSGVKFATSFSVATTLWGGWGFFRRRSILLYLWERRKLPRQALYV